MKTFKQFLTESEFTLDDIVRDCSEFLKQCGGKPLYRGIKEIDKTGGIMLQHTRTDRKPRDMNPELSRRLDLAIEKKVGFKTRSAGTFAIGDSAMANEYGTLCFVFPKNGFKFAWSPVINDPFVSFEIGGDDPVIEAIRAALVKHYTDAGQPSRVDLVKTGGASMMIRIAAEMAKDGKPEILDAAVETISSGYQADDLAAAIKSHNEIIFTGDYYALRVGAVGDVTDQNFESNTAFIEWLVRKL
jgi:hypothetical protein